MFYGIMVPSDSVFQGHIWILCLQVHHFRHLHVTCMKEAQLNSFVNHDK